MTDAFDRWTQNRTVRSLGTNSGSAPLAFQGWHHFKEAFPPELIRRAIDEDRAQVGSCLDPFGGSGTTALACQFLDVASTTVEVNPFLTDVIRAKICTYEADELVSNLGSVLRASRLFERHDLEAQFCGLPGTFLEPGLDGRWLFSRDCAAEVGALASAISELRREDHVRFFRVILGGILVELSNATVNGKGRRYRRNWQDRQSNARDVRVAFSARASDAIAEVHKHRHRPMPETRVIEGDAREVALGTSHDVAVFSPPYPNSFDYTDVYNIELWMLGYLKDTADNQRLRQSTLTSHVQLLREYSKPPEGSERLDTIVDELLNVQDRLWSRWIPAMVGGYFADMMGLLDRVADALRPGGTCWMVVGDSRYAAVHIPTAEILSQLVVQRGWSIELMDPFRSMRSSAQQGGRDELAETLVVTRRTGS